TCVVQVDGKVRDKVEVRPDVTAEALSDAVLARPTVRQALEGRTVVRVVSRPPRVVNVVTRS
ncbi:MAG TPA: hypothetical protein VI076_09160, partial [Actinopolymorphaceae bacterium]